MSQIDNLRARRTQLQFALENEIDRKAIVTLLREIQRTNDLIKEVSK